jgi:hypothetical protein
MTEPYQADISEPAQEQREPAEPAGVNVTPEAQARIDAANLERQANRAGPSHPAHWQHDQWLEERGLTRE